MVWDKSLALEVEGLRMLKWLQEVAREETETEQEEGHRGGTTERPQVGLGAGVRVEQER